MKVLIACEYNGSKNFGTGNKRYRDLRRGGIEQKNFGLATER
jgi:hypothetical protein